MGLFRGRISVENVDKTVNLSFSKSCAVRTKYIRHVFCATLRESVQMPEVCLARHGSNSPCPQRPSFALTQREVLVIRGRSKVILGTWLPLEEFDFLSSSKGEAVLRHWVSLLHVEERTFVQSE